MRTRSMQRGESMRRMKPRTAALDTATSRTGVAMWKRQQAPKAHAGMGSLVVPSTMSRTSLLQPSFLRYTTRMHCSTDRRSCLQRTGAGANRHTPTLRPAMQYAADRRRALRPAVPVAAAHTGDTPADTGVPGPALKPHGKLLRYLTGLTEEEQVDVFSKLAAAGFAVPGREDFVYDLTHDILKHELGIEPHALRSVLLQAFTLSGSTKVVVLVDRKGTEEVEFGKHNFEKWAAGNPLKLPSSNGRWRIINLWEQLQDGGTYYNTYYTGDMPSDTGVPGPEVKPHSKLLRHLTDLTEEEQADVFSKLAAAGFAKPGVEDFVDNLTNDSLKHEFGIAPQALRSLLLRAFALSGPTKAVMLVDEIDAEEVEFCGRRSFELWAAKHPLKLKSSDGGWEIIYDWVELQDGGTYYYM